jgi:N-succinyldiaminopimelate aminotransferase
VAASVLALCEVGDEVVVLEPTYDVYTAVIAMAGAIEVRVPLTPPAFTTPGIVEASWTLDPARFAAAITPRTRLVILNSPHNPTGAVLDEATLDAIAAICVDRDLLVVTDEVYEHLVFEAVHLPIATRAGMAERTITVSSAGKTFSCTGWKIGWACAPAPLSRAVRTTKQFLSFAGGTPLQHAIAEALTLPDAVIAGVVAATRARRDLLIGGLAELGLPVGRPAGTYFATADVRELGHDDGDRFCRWAPAEIGVAAVPVSAFVRDPEPVRSLVRFAFCKSDAVLEQGLARLRRIASRPAPPTATQPSAAEVLRPAPGRPSSGGSA